MMVSAPGNEIRLADIPEEFGGSENATEAGLDWTNALVRWANQEINAGLDEPLLNQAQPEFERALIQVALQHASGRKQDAARLLGWGRNTLTRKIRELKIDA